MPRLALPGRAQPCLASPCLAQPSPALPRLAVPCPAAPSLAKPCNAALLPLANFKLAINATERTEADGNTAFREKIHDLLLLNFLIRENRKCE